MKDLVAEYGQVIVDECHHVSAFTFERVLRKVKAKYVVGLTATPVRKDGHHPIILMQCGPIRFNVSSKKQARLQLFNTRSSPGSPNSQCLPNGLTSEYRISTLLSLTTTSERANRRRCCARHRRRTGSTRTHGAYGPLTTLRREALATSAERFCYEGRNGQEATRCACFADQSSARRSATGDHRDWALHWRRLRRRSAGHVVPGDADIVAGHASAVRWKIASSTRRTNMSSEYMTT